jgi:hypothetical protein
MRQKVRSQVPSLSLAELELWDKALLEFSASSGEITILSSQGVEVWQIRAIATNLSDGFREWD